MYFRNKKDLSDFLHEEMSANWIIAHTDKAFLFKYQNIKIQAIYFQYFENAEEIFDKFDFTVCMGAFDFSTEKFVLHKDFLKHNVSKILKFNANTSYPIVSALRVDKYKKKGFSISKSEFLRIMLSILNLHIDNYQDLRNQMGGMYGENYDNVLEPKEGEEFDIVKIIDKMKNLILDDKFFALPKDNEIGDWDSFICELLDEKIKCFIFDSKYYRIIRHDIQRICPAEMVENKKKYEVVDINSVVKFPQVRYKYVKLVSDGTMHSFYDYSYIWKIGENVAKNSSNGLYAVDDTNLKSCSYSREQDRVLLELKIESINDVNNIQSLLDNTCDYKRVVATRVVPLSEIESMIEKAESQTNEKDPW